MSITVKPVAAGTTAPTVALVPTISSWKDALTLIRMGLAFFFPWPFMTDRLETTVAARARRLSPRSIRRFGKSQ